MQETRRRQGNKTQAPTPKEQKATPSRGLQGSLNSRIANSNKTQAPNKRKKTRHEIDLRGFSHEAAVWKVLRRKENESKLKQTKRNHQSKEEEATRKEAKMKEQQAQAKRSHQRKRRRSHTKSLYGGVCTGRMICGHVGEQTLKSRVSTLHSKQRQTLKSFSNGLIWILLQTLQKSEFDARNQTF